MRARVSKEEQLILRVVDELARKHRVWPSPSEIAHHIGMETKPILSVLCGLQGRGIVEMSEWWLRVALVQGVRVRVKEAAAVVGEVT